ncbi:MAG: YihY/virulence factor BrkB family protein [Marmoricola sp.]|nr:YihY/virulence factor BrkB family protein [Marmoricola sp.]
MFGRKSRVHDEPEEVERVGPVTEHRPVTEATGLDAQRPPGAAHPLREHAEVPKRSFVFVVKRVVREFNDDEGTDLAAALTYYSVLAIFPALIALLSLVGLFGQTEEAVNKIIDILSPFVTDPTMQSRVREVIDGLAHYSGAGVGLVIGVVGALWSASGYVGAFSRAMNKIYEVEEGRPFWRMRPMQLVVTVVTVVLCAAGLVILVVSGPVAESIGRVLGVGSQAQQVWNIAKWPVLAVIVIVAVAVLFWATPNVRFPSFRVLSIGAFVAIMVWLAASVGFAFYLSHFGSYNKTYGSVAGAVVFLLWVWLTNVALIFGAELDAELERGRELQRGLAAEQYLQLPVRDRHGIEKNQKRRTEDIDRQRAIRLAASGGGDPGDRPFDKR